MKENARFKWPVRPVAIEDNIIKGKNYRITVLTPQLLRLEYSVSGCFEDRASQKVFYRDFPACPFQVSYDKDGVMYIVTEKLTVAYHADEPFDKDTLSVKLNDEPGSRWHFGETYDDLGGTVRTLDNVDGPISTERGLLSQWGFTVMNDSDSLVLNEEGWPEVRKDGCEDLYFFGYGYDYEGCIRDFYRLTGAPVMLPAYAFGNWWSRYYAYTQKEYLELVKRFRREGIPFSVAVIDMDWHLVDVDEPSRNPLDINGWTGYSWNTELFPDYKAFLKELHSYGLKTSLNLHPMDGIRKHESMYPEMAQALGLDPEKGETALLDILSQDYMSKYFDIVLHPYEDAGVDFWWLDWQQGTDYKWIHEPNEPGCYRDPRERMDPLWMLNHLHTADIMRSGKRPMLFSRYAGPGSHRYSIGFSGDTHITWESLDFQPYFTATSSNVGYCWWSHDIGGHMRGYFDSNLQVRWLQLGVLSPINRLHSSNSLWLQKEPWSYDPETEKIMKKWLGLRHSLFPYIYTMNYRCHSELVPMIRPMYYSHPKFTEAYKADNQYWFGTELIATPITSPDDPVSHTGATNVWLPEGDWFGAENGLHYKGLPGGRRIEVHRSREHMPVFAKAGAIVPLQRRAPQDNTLGGSEQMEVLVFPGAEGSFTMYEDAGDGDAYLSGECVKTEMKLAWSDEAAFFIAPARGDLSLIPKKRDWRIVLRGFHKDAVVRAFVNGNPVDNAAERDEETNSFIINIEAGVTEEIKVTVSGKELIHDNSDAMKRCFDLIGRAEISYTEKEEIQSIITNRAYNVRRKVYRFTGRAQARRGLNWAIREMLTLTEEAYPVKLTEWG